MLRLAMTFGLPIGAVIILGIILSLELADGVPGTGAQLIGYGIMLVAFSALYVGVRKYRAGLAEDAGFSFGKALLVGLAITGFAGVTYAVGWETYLTVTGTDFMAQYSDQQLADLKASGASVEEVEAVRQQLEQFAEVYANPVSRFLISLTEIVPVGLMAALASAFLLRRKPSAPMPVG